MGKVIPLLRPSQTLEAEQGLLGAIMLDSKTTLPEIIDLLTTNDFSAIENQTIYGAILALYHDGLDPDMVAVTEYLARHNKLDKIGGPGYLIGIVENAASALHAPYYAKIIREASFSRQYQFLLKKLMADTDSLLKGSLKLSSLLQDHEKQIYEFAGDYLKASPISHLSDVIDKELERLEKGETQKGLKIGLADLDTLNNGFHPCELIYLAARPGVGKTALAVQIAMDLKAPTIFFSLEMSSDDILRRMISRLTGIDSQVIREGRLSPDDYPVIHEALIKLRSLPIFITDQPMITVEAIRSHIRYMRRFHNIKLVIVDYLQIIKPPTGLSRENQISYISSQLKAIAKENEIPILCLAQLNREVEKRKDKVPILSDLRESGALEQDADQVIFLWDSGDQEGINFKLAKNRHGKTGKGFFRFDRKTGRFF